MSARFRCNPTSCSMCLSSFQFQINSVNRCDTGMGHVLEEICVRSGIQQFNWIQYFSCLAAAAFTLFPSLSSLPSHSLPLLSPGALSASRMQQQTDIDGFVQSCTLNFYICKTEIIHYRIQRGKLISQCAHCTLKIQN